MKNEITDEQLLAFMEGANDPYLEEQLEKDAALQQRYAALQEVMNAVLESEDFEVPLEVSQRFQGALEEEKQRLVDHSLTTQTKWSVSPWQIAASVALLVLGFGLGKFSGNPDQSSAELVSLREEITSLKQVTMASALRQHSASERILAVSQIQESSVVNTELTNALINTLNTDESPNVRYAALQALTKYLTNKDIRSELVKSLETQVDPLIQISLINTLMEAEEQSAVSPLKQMIVDDNIAPEVKRQAEIALQVLI